MRRTWGQKSRGLHFCTVTDQLSLKDINNMKILSLCILILYNTIYDEVEKKEDTHMPYDINIIINYYYIF